ncbi:patatin-like phospholipase family protein [Flavobacterium sp.]|jgi:NTE family protein|uniref:patatin-like phospholipase family protein n=1 Tax=Flavobacterium sp. TaxID=239 RepID=UPI0037C0347A
MNKHLLWIGLFLFFQLSFGQETVRPKVGLVLSGGGAKGLAHIGVLKTLDSLNIKVDYIAGTSMGAVVGGLYASGYSAKQLDSIFSKLDVNALLQDYTPRESKSFYEKRNDEIYALTLPFSNFKLGLPSGLSKGLYNFNLISRLTKHVSHIREFNQLPIPFLCIATDLETGNQVVLEKGILAEAIIASGALPTLYNPIEINGRLLIDGGVVNNYPVEELTSRGITVIIGVDVQEGLKNRTQLNDVTAVLSQINNFSMIEKMEEKKRLTTIYINPEVKGYSVVSFEKGTEIIQKGNDKANEYSNQIKAIAHHSAQNRKVIQNDSITIADITSNKLENYTKAYLVGKLKIKKNTTITHLQLEKAISNINATQNFSAITYSFEKRNKGERLVLNLKENKNNTFLKFGIHYDDLYKSGVLVNYTHKKIITKNDVVALDVVLGDNFRYNFDYYIDNGFYWSFGVNSKLNAFNRNISTDFENGVVFTDLGINSINIDFTELTHQAYLQTLFAQKFSVGAGVEFKHLKIQSQTLQNTTPIFDNSDYLSAFGYLKYDSFNHKYFPNKGWSFAGELKSYLYSSNFTEQFERFSIARAEGAIVFEPLKKCTIKSQTEIGFAIGRRSISFFDFVLGGYGFAPTNNFKPFFGYDFLSVAGDSYIKQALTIDYEFYKKHHVNFAGNFATIGNRIFEHKSQWLERPKHTGYAIGYGMESIVGPLEIKHSWSPETRNHFTWFSIGFWF